MPDPRVGLINDVVAKAYGVSPEAIMSRDKTKPVREARMVAMALVRELLRYSPPRTGAAFRRDRTTVNHNIKVVAAHLDKVNGWAGRFTALRDEARKALDAADIVITACDTLRDDLIRKVKADPAAALARIVNAFNREDRP